MLTRGGLFMQNSKEKLWKRYSLEENTTKPAVNMARESRYICKGNLADLIQQGSKNKTVCLKTDCLFLNKPSRSDTIARIVGVGAGGCKAVKNGIVKFRLVRDTVFSVSQMQLRTI